MVADFRVFDRDLVECAAGTAPLARVATYFTAHVTTFSPPANALFLESSSSVLHAGWHKSLPEQHYRYLSKRLQF
jgi:hypothetical protein